MVVTLFGMALLHPMAPNDVYWHLAGGRSLAHHGAIPANDTYSFVAQGRPFAHLSWLAEWLMYQCMQIAGVSGLHVTFAVAAVATYVVVAQDVLGSAPIARRFAPLAVLLAMSCGLSNLSVRPQTLCFVLFAWHVYVLAPWLGRERVMHRLRWRWTLPWLILVWCNLHGSFVLGLVLQGVALLSVRRWAALTVTLFSVLCSLANPLGWRLYAHVFGFVNPHSLVRRVASEWAPLQPWSGEWWLVCGAIFLCMLVWSLARRRPPIGLAFATMMMAMQALSAGRNVVWFGLVAAPLLMDGLAAVFAGRSMSFVVPPASIAFRRFLWAVAIAELGFMLPLVRNVSLMNAWLPPAETGVPVSAVRFLQRFGSQAPRRLFAEEGYASYLIWSGPASSQVFSDTRFELYSAEELDDYTDVANGNNLGEITARRSFDGMLFRKETQPKGIAALRGMPGWKLVLEDSESALFVRDLP